MIREILEQAIQVARAKLTKDSTTAFKERWQLYYLAGRAVGARIPYRARSERRENNASSRPAGTVS
jgi:hypothetical protein